MVRYLFGPRRANEHHDQRAVALARSLSATPVGETLDRRQVAALGQRMDAMRVKFKEPAQGALRRAKVVQVAGDSPGLPAKLAPTLTPSRAPTRVRERSRQRTVRARPGPWPHGTLPRRKSP